MERGVEESRNVPISCVHFKEAVYNVLGYVAWSACCPCGRRLDHRGRRSDCFDERDSGCLERLYVAAPRLVGECETEALARGFEYDERSPPRAQDVDGVRETGRKTPPTHHGLQAMKQHDPGTSPKMLKELPASPVRAVSTPGVH